MIITRFAPSPTGTLHIGSVRTALFNWIFARSKKGKCILRIEDTDQIRSNDIYKESIINGLDWIGIDLDKTIAQSDNWDRYKAVAQYMIDNNLAYYSTHFSENKYVKGNDNKNNNDGDLPAIRARIANRSTDSVIIKDMVQGEVEIGREEIQDIVIMRSNGMPTYMFAVVVDDHDCDITHIMRGVDHLKNTATQIELYKLLSWDVPKFAHIPLIHDEDGRKLSKRRNAVDLEFYRSMGILPQAMCSYLLGLGWNGGGDDIVSLSKAIEIFDIQDINASPSRFDMQKLLSINHHYIKQLSFDKLLDAFYKFVNDEHGISLSIAIMQRISKGIKGLCDRSYSLKEMYENAAIYINDLVTFNDHATQIIKENHILLSELIVIVGNIADDQWDENNLKQIITMHLNDTMLNKKIVFQLIRSVLAGNMESPGIFEILSSIGKDLSIQRFKHALSIV